MRRSRLALLVVSWMSSFGCRSEPIARTHPPSAAPAPSPASALPPEIRDCGSEKSAHGSGVNSAARECFWHAYEEGRPARLIITLHTIEGDPMRYELHVKSRTAIYVTYESQDRFGTQGTSRFRCSALEQTTPDGHIRFTLRGCQGGGSEELTIP
ncbi:MAG TPA: hypothetical protein VK524_16415 [Polyangiaceae bacterium]|nr:hypothetical protein [Polyangiaceae bacterium]